MTDRHHETQEQSIKARKRQLFEADAPAGPVGSGRPFEDFLRDTPAEPLSGGAKAVLWAAGVVVVLVLVAALAKVISHHGKAAPKAAGKAAATLDFRPIGLIAAR